MNKIISLENYRKKRDDEVFAAVGGAENFYWYATDIRGSSSSILKSDSTASHGVKRVRDFSYDAYGNTTDTLQNTTDTEMDEIAYTGGVFDKELGLYYLMSRYYDPAIAQFISEDSYRGDGEHFWNLYMYCEGDPVNGTDRTGHYMSVTNTYSKRINTYASMQLHVYYKTKEVKNIEHIKLEKVTAKIICKKYPSGNYLGYNRHMLSRYIAYCIIGAPSPYIRDNTVYLNTESGKTAKRAYLVGRRSRSVNFSLGYLAKCNSVIRIKFHIDFCEKLPAKEININLGGMD